MKLQDRPPSTHRRGLACGLMSRALLACLLLGLVPASSAAKASAAKNAQGRRAKPAAAATPAPEASPTPAAAGARAPLREIQIEHEESAYPASDGLQKYALVIKRKGEKQDYFETDPRLVEVAVSPAGASDLTVRSVTPTRIAVDFWAPADFKVKDVSVTFYDPADPRKVAAVSTKEKPGGAKPGADKPGGADASADGSGVKINATNIIFLQRAQGIGRVQIVGEGFGDHAPPNISAEDYLLCFEPLAHQALVDALQMHPERDARATVEQQRCNHLKDGALTQWHAWREGVEKSLKVSLVPRNTDLRIEQTKVLYADDKLIDVYFEFNRFYRFSEPLRLASTTVTVKRPKEAPAPANSPAPRSDVALFRPAAVGAAGEDVKPDASKQPAEYDTFIAVKEVGTKRDENLEYRYTVLDVQSASNLFGSGVAEAFYVIQLSVTNKGEKKVAVPLASIQAEVEWAFGPSDEAAPPESSKAAAQKEQKGELKKYDTAAAGAPLSVAATGPGRVKDYYEEGPATLAPLPLPAVTGFFDSFNKVKGKKARLFNVFDGMAMLGSSIIPFVGPGFRDAHVAFTGGLVPGVRRGLGDLSGQQLQNLTALSWQSVEVIAGRGGSVDKFVFIQRGDQIFGAGFNERLRKTIKNIQGMEVIGFEVIESEARRATPAGQ